MAKRSAPEVNAGSMADIAFLLLIFFLVTTTIEVDSGINSKLPPDEPPKDDVRIKQKNIFTVELNKNNQMLVEGDLMEVKDLKAAAIKLMVADKEMINVLIVKVQKILRLQIILEKRLYL